MEKNLFFPSSNELTKFLNLVNPAEIEDLLSKSLGDPLADLLNRPKKDLRGRFVELGFQIAKLESQSTDEFEDLLSDAREILELLHAGSLIIDDIEDGTLMRRGKKALHIEYGLPVALNAGNWLYFRPFQKIEQMQISPEKKFLLSQECHRTLLRAHYGQALDVGIPINSLEQSRVPEVVLAAMELKTGVLAGFALKLGALTVGCSEPLLLALDTWGRKLGLALQMFDDIGNLSSKANPEKRGEDLKLMRPSYVFAVAAQALPSESYRQLIQNLETQQIDKTIELIRDYRIDSIGRAHAKRELDECNQYFKNELGFSHLHFKELEEITEKLVMSYE